MLSFVKSQCRSCIQHAHVAMVVQRPVAALAPAAKAQLGTIVGRLLQGAGCYAPDPLPLRRPQGRAACRRPQVAQAKGADRQLVKDLRTLSRSYRSLHSISVFRTGTTAPPETHAYVEAFDPTAKTPDAGGRRPRSAVEQLWHQSRSADHT
jgi:hypothetical protein